MTSKSVLKRMEAQRPTYEELLIINRQLKIKLAEYEHAPTVGIYHAKPEALRYGVQWISPAADEIRDGTEFIIKPTKKGV